MSANDNAQALVRHVRRLRACRRCADMIRPVVTGAPVMSPVMLIGQAPGNREGAAGRPFAWTAGKTLFRWFAVLGMDEATFRRRVYMAAVCRCFPGKNPKGGDRVPATGEITNCTSWLERELALLKPALIIPVGKLAIAQWIAIDKLRDVVGRTIKVQRGGFTGDLIALPHPSGASTWHRTAPGRELLGDALALIGAHRAWRALGR